MGRDIVNLNITAPLGTTDHGDPRILCTPASWTDILSFYLENFFTHVGTVVTYPGESDVSVVVALVSALLLPTAGIARALTAIVRCAKLAKTPLEVAARAGALCHVVRSDIWTPEDGDDICDAILRGPFVDYTPALTGFDRKVDKFGRKLFSTLLRLPISFGVPREVVVEKYLSPDRKLDRRHRWTENSDVARRMFWPPWADPHHRYWHLFDTEDAIVDKQRKVHGSFHLAKGYELAYLPPNAAVFSNMENNTATEEDVVSANYSLPKAIAAIIQLLFSISTLYKASGSQIEHYGYAAFALTVVPYASMSFINLIATALTPSYPALYMVHSDIMDEAIRRGAKFDGVVGRVAREPVHIENDRYDCFAVRCQPQAAAENRSELSLLSNTMPHVSSYSKSSSHVRLLYDDQDSAAHEIIRFRSLEREGVLSQLGSKGYMVRALGVSNEVNPPCPSLLIPACSNISRQRSAHFPLDPVNFSAIGRINLVGDMLTLKYDSGIDGIRDTANILLGLLPVAIVGSLSRFHARNSSRAEQCITMIWLGIGAILGPAFVNHAATIRNVKYTYGNRNPIESKKMRRLTQTVIWLILPLAGAAPVAGFIIVGMMIKQWGSCTELD